jgi:hypothetical protein
MDKKMVDLVEEAPVHPMRVVLPQIIQQLQVTPHQLV